MATKQIAWQTGSGNITLTYQGRGDGTVAVQSDANNIGSARSQQITIETTAGSPVVTKNLTISQGACPIPVGTVLNYAYTGNAQSVLLPAGRYKLQCWGAQGGSVSGSYTATGAKGGYSEGELTLTSPTTVYIFVGGQGSSAATSTTGGMQNGGFNGGGGAPRICQYNSGDHYGISYPRPGGGATDISLVDSDVAYSNYRTNRSEASLLARQIVAGGGAGASARYTYSTITNTVSGSSTNGYYIGTIEDSELLPLPVYSSQSNSFWYTDGIRSANGFTLRKYRVNAGQKYYFSTSFNKSANIWAVAWYDVNGNMISYESDYKGSMSSATTFTDEEVTAPSGAYYLYLNTTTSHNYYSCKTYVLVEKGIGPKSSSSYKYYRYPVTAGQTYHVEVGSFSADSGYHPIAFGGAISSGMISGGEYYSGWSQSSSGFNGDVTIPSGKSYMYITCGTSNSAPTVTYTTTSTSSGTSNGTQVGGGISGGGTNPGTQSGGGGELGKGANMTATNYRYASGGGGGGYYGGGASYDDVTMNMVNQSGGGSGFVSSDLTNAQTKTGNTSFPSTSGGTETGHSGNGYARITRLS